MIRAPGLLGSALAVLALVAGAGTARAHKPSDSYLTLRASPAGGQGQWDIALRDLDDVLALDGDGDGALTWGELARREAELARYALGRLGLHTGAGPCAPAAGPLTIVQHSDGPYARLALELRCPVGGSLGSERLTVEYRLLFDRDPSHRAIVDVQAATAATAVLGEDSGRHEFAFGRQAGAGSGGPSTLLAFVGEGVTHIWGGVDHLLFLLALLLPAVLRQRDGDAGPRWTPVAALPPVLADVARVVTAFTVAHSLTLTLAAVGLVRVSGRIIEPAIAASVVLASINNIRPLLGRDRWVMALALGLLHGFGFSSALADLGLPRARQLPSLLGFNLGVELGQLSIVLLFLPLAYALRRRTGYRRLALYGGSLAIAVVAVIWLVERALDVSFIS